MVSQDRIQIATTVELVGTVKQPSQTRFEIDMPHFYPFIFSKESFDFNMLKYRQFLEN